MPQLHIIGTCTTIHVGEYFWLMTGKTFRPKELHNTSSFISNSARETVVVGGHLSLGTII